MPGGQLAGANCRPGRALLGRVACACVVLAALAGCGSGSGSGGDSGPSQASATPASCPSAPVTGPRHTLTFPRSISGFQIAKHSPFGSGVTLDNGQATCFASATSAVYTSGQYSKDFTNLTITAGYHSDRWQTFTELWGSEIAVSGGKVTYVPAGPLGGQAGCGTDDEGTFCDWFDNDTFGEMFGQSTTPGGLGIPAEQAGSIMLTFRDAIEHGG
jgi:hypothetical protein